MIARQTAPRSFSLSALWSGRLLFGILALLGLAAAVVRFANGMGAISNMTDEVSWGIWIGFDLLCGVALAAGAFVVAAAVYILDLKQFRPLLRPAILTGFLGYLMVIVALLVDLGRPERIWHLLVFWNPHSVLFEIGWCVMLYSTVLFLEFSPILFERLKWNVPLKAIHAITLPLVILGVVLSTLHQSSLGSLHLLMREKIHTLWHSPLLPLFFFLTAAAVGIAMVVVESTISARVYRRGLETDLLGRLSKALPWILGLYLLVKFGELAVTGDLGHAFTDGWISLLFWVEVIGGIGVPLVLFSRPATRRSERGLLTGALLIVGGVILNRLSVNLITWTRPGGAGYVPHWMEIAVTVGILSAGILAYDLAVRYLPVFTGEPEEHQEAVAGKLRQAAR